MGYHKTSIPKGKLGEFSKIKEEYLELFDANQQSNKVLEICEMCDLVGAVMAYASQFNLTIEDLVKMANATADAFKDGSRK